MSGLVFELPEVVEPSPGQPHRSYFGGGSVLADLDGDGVLDLFIPSIGGHNGLFRGRGDGGFERVVGTPLEEGVFGVGATAADLDGDGLKEVLLADGQLLRLFRNDGDWQFTELPSLVAGEPYNWPVGAVVADLDGDDQLDIYVPCHMDWEPGMEPVGGSDYLLRGTGDLQFTDVTHLLGQPEERFGLTFAGTWLDSDDDGSLDLYVVNDKGGVYGGNRLYRGDLTTGYVDLAEETFSGLEIRGMGVSQGTLGNTSSPSLVMSDIGAVHVLTFEHGLAVDQTENVTAYPSDVDEHYPAWGLQLEDFDNDADLDLLTAWSSISSSHLPFDGRVGLRLWEKGAFQPLAANPGEVPGYWRSVLPGDLNRDGQLDWVATPLFGSPRVVLGRPTGNHWLRVDLLGRGDNSEALGALVVVRSGETRQERRLVAGGQGVHSSSESVAHFGLGRHLIVDEVEVQWPDGSVTRKMEVAADQEILIEQGVAD